MINLKKQNFKSIEITDISAVDESVWKPKLEKADVLFFEGGYTYHLMKWLNKSSLAKMLLELLKNKVYVGVSAGSMVTNKKLVFKISQITYREHLKYLDKVKEMSGLNFVDFYFLPHLNSHKELKENFIRRILKGMSEKIYALDDNSALKIIDEKIEVISKGKWFVIN